MNTFYILYFFLILLALCWVGVFTKANLTFFFLVHFFVGPIVRVFVTLMLSGKFSLLILSYLAAKDVQFANVQWDSTSFKYNFLSHCLRLLPLKKILNKGLAISPMNGAAADAISPSDRPFPLCFLYIFLPLLFLPPIYLTPFLTDCVPLVPTNLCQFDWLHMFCALRSVYF